MSRAIRWILAGLLLALPAAGSAGVSLRIPLSYRTWNLPDGTTASQWVAPIVAVAPLTRDLDLSLQGAAQSGKLEAAGTSSLTGVTDTRAGLSYRLASGRCLLQAGINLPTGPRELDPEQALVTLALSPPALGYRVRQVGHGLDLGVGATYAVPLSPDLALGFGASVLKRGKLRALAGEPEVEPGNELHASVGLDGTVRGGRLTLDLTRRVYGKDKGSGADYQEPASWEGSIGFSGRAGRWAYDALALGSRKEQGDLRPYLYTGRYLAGTVSLRHSLGRRGWFGAEGEAVDFRGDAVAGARATSTTYGFGPILIFPIGEPARIEARASRLTGKLDGESIDGWDIGLAITIAR